MLWSLQCLSLCFQYVLFRFHFLFLFLFLIFLFPLCISFYHPFPCPSIARAQGLIGHAPRANAYLSYTAILRRQCRCHHFCCCQFMGSVFMDAADPAAAFRKRGSSKELPGKDTTSLAKTKNTGKGRRRWKRQRNIFFNIYIRCKKIALIHL